MVEIIALFIGSGMLLLIYMLVEAFSNTVKREELLFGEYPQSADPLRIFFISDVHRRIIHDKIIDDVKGDADFVIIGGDLTEKGVSLERIRKNIKKLNELGPVYFIWGNNDYEADVTAFRDLLQSERVTLLENESSVLEREGDFPVALIGVEELSVGRADLPAAFEKVPDEAFRIFLAHNPGMIQKLDRSHNVSLVLSGHTHGGQIRCFGLGLYPKGGIRQAGKTTVLVSNGYGTTALPLRLGAPAETHLLTIKSD